MSSDLHMGLLFVLGETFQQAESMIFLVVYKCIRSCVNFHVGTFRVRISFWPNLHSPLEHLMKVVLVFTCSPADKCYLLLQLR